MKKPLDNRVERTLEFIKKDRIIPKVPWFYSRLVARMERESTQIRKSRHVNSISGRLKPVFAVMAILIAVAGGILLGKALSEPAGTPEISSISSLADDPSTAFYGEINGSSDEQKLLLK
ncbi:MAG: hypothetical protein V1733_01435 [bacterium]